jgi:DNA-binding XRE family transcriptional regulator
MSVELSLIERVPIGRGPIVGVLIASFPLRERMMTTDPRAIFGLRLIEVRKAKGWSQERLALESGLARSYLGGVERGQRNIALLNIYKLAEALAVTPGSLMDSPTAK